MGNDYLTNINFVREQATLFTRESLYARTAGKFDPGRVNAAVKLRTGTLINAFDIGGSKLRRVQFAAGNGRLQEVGANLYESKGGAGFLKILEDMKGDLEATPVAIAVAGVVEGARLVSNANLAEFISDLEEKYDGDFINLFPGAVVFNDAVALSMMAAKGVMDLGRRVQNVVTIINGSGLGGSLWQNGEIVALEPGHVRVADGLNLFGRKELCGSDGAEFVCVENVAAGVAGIEKTYTEKKGAKLTGRQITEMVWDDQLAKGIVDNAAVVTAATVGGIFKAFGLDARQTAVVGHGGTFDNDYFRQRVDSALAEIFKIGQVILSSSLAAHPGAMGAAYGWYTSQVD